MKRISPVFYGLFFLFQAAASGESCANLNRRFELVARYLRMEQYFRKAYNLPNNELIKKITLYSKAIDQVSGYEEWILNCVRTHRTEGEKIVPEIPKLFLVWSNRASVYINLGQWNLAISDGKKGVSLARHESFPWGILGRAYAGIFDIDRSISALRQAIKLAEDSEEEAYARNELGNAYYSFGQYHKAEAELRQIIEPLPIILTERLDNRFFAKVYNNLGLSLRAQNKLVDSIKNFKKSMRWDSESTRATMNGAWTALSAGENELAKEWFRVGRNLNRGDAWARIESALALIVSNQWKSALDELDLAEEQIEYSMHRHYWVMFKAFVLFKLDHVKESQALINNYTNGLGANNEWPVPILKAWSGEVNPKKLTEQIQMLEVPQPRKEEKMSEAEFYLALHALTLGNEVEYQSRLQRVVKSNKSRLIEWVIAKQWAIP